MSDLEFDGVCWEVRRFDRTFFKRVHVIIDIFNKHFEEDAYLDGKSIDQLLHVEASENLWGDSESGKFDPARDGIGLLLLLLTLHKEFHESPHEMTLVYEQDHRSDGFSLRIEDHKKYIEDIGYKLKDIRPLCEVCGLMLPDFTSLGVAGSVDF